MGIAYCFIKYSFFSVANSHELWKYPSLLTITSQRLVVSLAIRQWVVSDYSGNAQITQPSLKFTSLESLSWLFQIVNQAPVLWFLGTLALVSGRCPSTYKLLCCLSHVPHQQNGNKSIYHWVVKIKWVESLYHFCHNFILWKTGMIIIVSNLIGLLWRLNKLYK